MIPYLKKVRSAVNLAKKQDTMYAHNKYEGTYLPQGMDTME
jgi:hypothetical protein